MPKHTKKVQPQRPVARGKPYNSQKRSLGNQSTTKSQQHDRSLRAAAGALLTSFGRGGVLRLLEETEADLIEKGIVKKHGIANSEANIQRSEHEQRMKAVPSTAAAAQPAVFRTTTNPTAAPTEPSMDINVLISGWSLKQPAADADDIKRISPQQQQQQQDEQQQDKQQQQQQQQLFQQLPGAST